MLQEPEKTNVNSSFWIHAIKTSGGLSSVDRINEILFGLVMVLTFTCSISAATHGREEISTILWSALGCNVAWGLIDSFMYLFSILLERGETFASIRNIRNATTEESGNNAVKEAIPPVISQIIKKEHITDIWNAIKNLPEPPAKVFLTLHDLHQAFLIFILVFLSTFPVTLPFIFTKQVLVAMRISNTIALVSLFLTGVYLAKKTGRRKIVMGFAFALIGSILVSITMALGG